MKKLNIILLIGCFWVSACDLVEVVDVDPPNNLVPENVANTDENVENLLNGAYAPFNGRDYYLYYETFPGLLSGSMEIRTAGQRSFESNAIEVDDIFVVGFWRTFYSVANMSSTVIDLVGELPDEEFAIGRKDEILGEAHFLRAFCHFDALRYFGQFYDLDSDLGIIIRTVVADFTNSAQSRRPVLAVYEQILADLDIAIAQAPDFTLSYLASKTAAKTLKAKVLLFMGRYAEAAALAEEVINEGTRSLEPTFADVFDNGLTSDEVIFMRHTDEVTAGSIQARLKDFTYGFRQIQASDWLVEFMGEDPRVETAFLANQGIKKVHNEESLSPTFYLRLSEVYLIQAEALARSGASLEAAKAPLEAVRARAFGEPQPSAATTIDELLEEIYAEIILELSFENGSEWFAGIRFDKIMDIKATVMSENQYILPIPLDEIEANNQLSFRDQNPGYTQ